MMNRIWKIDVGVSEFERLLTMFIQGFIYISDFCLSCRIFKYFFNCFEIVYDVNKMLLKMQNFPK